MRLKVRNISFLPVHSHEPFLFLEMKKAVASDGKARAEAERCRKMSNQAIKEHATMKEQYTMNVTKLKWLENKLQVESEALGKLVTFSPLIHLNLIIRLRFYWNQCVMRIFI